MVWSGQLNQYQEEDGPSSLLGHPVYRFYTSLPDTTLARARERRFKTLTLWVLEDNPRARRFYEAVGFTPDGATKSEKLREDVVLHEVRYRMEIAGPDLKPGCDECLS